jgi:phospholipase C
MSIPRVRARALTSVAMCASLVLASCTSHHPQIAPSPVDAKRFHTQTKIKHLIFVIKENRSFDNMFGTFPGADGATVGKLYGKTVPLEHSPAFTQRMEHDLPHDRIAALKDFNHGKMDGFGFNSTGAKYAYTQLTQEQLPNYWHWAENFVLSDRFFASVNGPSFPNHLFTIAAQSGGTVDNPDAPSKSDRGDFKTWGCDAPETETVEVHDTEGKVLHVPPCFDFQTVGDELTDHHVPWSYYAAAPVAWEDAPHSGYIWNAYAAVGHYRNDPKSWEQHVFPVQHFEDDVKDGHLAPVTWVTPQFAYSEHPEYNFCHGENWTTRVVDAVMQSPYWKDSAIVVTWDDWGGLYDHVAPEQIDRYGLGIRVPFMLISPYAKQGYIDHRHGEFSDVVKFIEDNWDIGHLDTPRDLRAGDLFQDFDFSQEPRAPDVLPQRTDCEGPAFSPPPPDAYK